MSADPVFVDTTVWVDALRGGPALDQLRPLILTGQALLPSPVATELLCGSRPGKDRAAVETLLRTCPAAVPEAEDYRAAGLAGAGLRRRGVTVGTVDLLLAAVALRLDAPVWSFDAHFQAMARHGGPRLFEARLPISS